jgi:hypothetical protein
MAHLSGHGDIRNHLSQSQSVRAHILNVILRLTQLRRGDQLHGLRDLLGIFSGLDPSPNIL